MALNVIIRTIISGSSETPEPTSPVVTGPTSENPPSINPSTGVNNYTGVLKIVYLDPTDLTKKCDASNSVSKTKTKTGCMKWYAYAEDDTTYTMILDHNTTAQVEWNSSGSNSSMKGVATQLASDTTGWNGNPRLITANEIVTITGNTSWPTGISYFDTLTASGTNEGKYGWLFDRTSSSCKTYGCLNNAIGTIGTFGYWTSSPIANTSDGVWAVYYFGYLGSNNVTAADRGVRPVITIDKSYVN